ncbi:hypothetical protein QBC43DRAFT_349163 [Cladorrhinum sp. PSN259]|nr:hypothetical protein QBC43DRAFT_349163 [Cladorrhinum sp. PSN259]
MHGVVGIKNIPYHLHRNELIALLGRNSRMLNDIDEGVHIIMERLTAKTLDAYVEFLTLDDAVKCVNRMREKAARGSFATLISAWTYYISCSCDLFLESD